MTESELADFIAHGGPYYGEGPEALESLARDIEARFGYLMLRRMLVWLHDPYARESPLVTYTRWARWLGGAQEKGPIL